MSAITSIDELDLKKIYSYADYLKWQFKERVELLGGKVFKMTPAPNRIHQRISGDLYGFLWNFLHDKQQHCQVFSAPFDVRLPSLNEDIDKIETVVQPDIAVICNENKLDEQGCIGAPDLVVEVLSPGNSEKEMKYKFELYEQAGVSEYWIVDPIHQMIMLYTLSGDGQYVAHRPYVATTKLKSETLAGFELDLSKIFK